jgi:hypothetical protein
VIVSSVGFVTQISAHIAGRTRLWLETISLRQPGLPARIRAGRNRSTWCVGNANNDGANNGANNDTVKTASRRAAHRLCHHG